MLGSRGGCCGRPEVWLSVRGLCTYRETNEEIQTDQAGGRRADVAHVVCSRFVQY